MHRHTYGCVEHQTLLKEQCALNRDAPDDAYIPEPFLEEEFKPVEWRDILATLDVCVNETMPTVFCDEEGYNVIPICMIKVNHQEEDLEEGKQEQTVLEIGKTPEDGEEIETAIRRLGLQDEISIRDLSKEEDEEKKTQSFITHPTSLKTLTKI